MRALLLLGLLVPAWPAAAPGPAADGYGFQFVRIRYDTLPYVRYPTWRYDYPTAEQNLYIAIERTTKLYVEGPNLVMTLEDPRIFEYPILYLCEPGYWQASPEEIRALRQYLDRGGFLIIDDFHDFGDGRFGPEWENFYQIMKRLYPEREPVELTPDHPIWSIYYDIDPDAAVSTKIETGEVPWLDADDDTYYGIFDPDGRLLIVVCYNQDIGDGWEWPNYNRRAGSTVSFQMAINFILYALTH